MSEAKRQGPMIRRIVTGHDAAGKAVVWMDGPAGNHKFPNDKATSTLMWVTDETPCDFTTEIDAGQRVLGTPPPAGGTRFAIMELQPGAPPRIHRTDTIDYVICLSGEVEMDLDDSTVKMKSGDVMIQRGTNHGWANRSNAPARLAFVLIDGQPKRPGSLT
ncbi:MAG TPA: cupin domain-containing protein [Alphaproteobacteria bacterium]